MCNRIQPTVVRWTDQWTKIESIFCSFSLWEKKQFHDLKHQNVNFFQIEMSWSCGIVKHFFVINYHTLMTFNIICGSSIKTRQPNEKFFNKTHFTSIGHGNNFHFYIQFNQTVRATKLLQYSFSWNSFVSPTTAEKCRLWTKWEKEREKYKNHIQIVNNIII